MAAPTDDLTRQIRSAVEALAYAYDDVDASAKAIDLQHALSCVQDAREQLNRLELVLLDAARAGGGSNAGAPPIDYRTWLTWAEVATALRLESRQAAEQRYRRLRERHPDVAAPPAPLIKTLAPTPNE